MNSVLHLTISYIFLIFNSQGLTLSKTAVIIGSNELMLAENYIAFSIVCCIVEILIEASFAKDRLNQIKKKLHLLID